MIVEFDQMNTGLAVHTPLDAIFAEYREKKSAIEKIATYVRGQSDAILYFLLGANKDKGWSAFTASSLFDPVPAIKALDASYWARVMSYTDVLESMNAERRNEWNKNIQEHETPPFEIESVRETLKTLMAQRQDFFAERVDGIFRVLSGNHKTNRPEGFSTRMIIEWLIGSYGQVNSDKANYIHDLRAVVAMFMGRGSMGSLSTYHELDRIIRNGQFGEWVEFDGGALRVRIYKKGTAHLEVHPEMSWRLNQVLAYKNPLAIPNEFRVPPKKPAKAYFVDNELIPFEALQQLRDGHYTHSNTAFNFTNGIKPHPMAIEILERLGGIKNGLYWEFDYPVGGVIYDVIRMGSIPERKTHQFYPTPENLARMAVDLADIEDGMTILEPSAGTGAIAKYLPVEQTTCVELAKIHCRVLEEMGYKTHCFDFLRMPLDGSLQWRGPEYDFMYDRIVMNPPFSEGRWKAHLLKAAKHLKAGGKLVAILPPTERDKEIVPGFRHEWSEVFHDEFEGTSVSVTILKLEKL